MSEDISLEGFDADQVPDAVFEVIPAGKYIAQIVASEKKPTNDGQGSFIELDLEILSGEYERRRLRDRLNLWNKSEMAVAFANQSLKAICNAVGIPRPPNTKALEFKPMTVSVKVRPAGPDKSGTHREASNEIAIGGYAPAPGVALRTTSPVAQTVVQPAATVTAQTVAQPITPTQTAGSPFAATPGGAARTSPPWAKKAG